MRSPNVSGEGPPVHIDRQQFIAVKVLRIFHFLLFIYASLVSFNSPREQSYSAHTIYHQLYSSEHSSHQKFISHIELVSATLRRYVKGRSSAIDAAERHSRGSGSSGFVVQQKIRRHRAADEQGRSAANRAHSDPKLQ